MPRGTVFKKLLYNSALSGKDNRIFRIFNLMLLVVIGIVAAISIFLLSLGIYLGFLICIGEIIIFSLLLWMHIRGHIYTSRYIFFVFAILSQVFGSLYHGESGGFDFLFFSAALTPVLFFEKKIHYFSLFVLSIATYMGVKYAYELVDPIFVFQEPYSPYYLNIIISALLIYYGYVLFKSEHLKYEEELKSQQEEIQSQHEALSDAQRQMQILLAAKMKKMEAQSDDIIKYADINAHIVRSPLARILGLTNLAKYEDLNCDKTRNYYFEQIESNANELDQALREINTILNKNIADR